MRIKDIKGKNVKSSYALDMADVIKVDDLVKLMSAQTDLFKLDEFVIRF